MVRVISIGKHYNLLANIKHSRRYFDICNMRFFPLKTCNRRLCSVKSLFPNIPVHLRRFIEEADLKKIEENLLLRKHNNNVPIIADLIRRMREPCFQDICDLEAEILKLPNDTHPRLQNVGKEPKVLEVYSPGKSNRAAQTEFSEITKYMRMLRMDHLGNFAGHKSYYILGKLAELEQAIEQYTLNQLRKRGFYIMAVPDILPAHIIEACGMRTNGDRTQIYELDSKFCLSGTSEMSLAGFFANKSFNFQQLPIKVAAVSRCFRAETSGLQEEKGIYRVHQFNKVEMFSICSQEQSDEMLEYFKKLQLDIFRCLNIKYRLLDMPPDELGAPAYQKYDIEAWMPGRKMWGEISSCSNCTDYQAKRLNIKYCSDQDLFIAHTVNGTAAAIPRLLICIVESNQRENDSICVPEVLSSFMSEFLLSKDRNIPETKLIKQLKI